jgi:hypothetical protein
VELVSTFSFQIELTISKPVAFNKAKVLKIIKIILPQLTGVSWWWCWAVSSIIIIIADVAV